MQDSGHFTHSRRWVASFCLALLTTVPTDVVGDGIAFPGAVGQGASATGGRGGDVYHVTTLDDYNPDHEAKIPGSLRHAIRSATGPRTIVFDISGVIDLHAPLEIRKSNLTIAGQTSPGGITLTGYPLEINDCHDVIVRYLRVRTGDFHARNQTSTSEVESAYSRFDAGSANAANVGHGCDRVILDHLSTSWGLDECLSVTGCRNVTVQHCIISESLNDSFHPKGQHGFGSLVRGALTEDDQRNATGGYTFHGNLWAHHRARNPSIGGEQWLRPGAPESDRRRTDVNLTNNIVYNWGDNATHRSQNGHVRINLIGNYYITGPAKDSHSIFREGDVGQTELYHQGNFLDSDQDSVHNGKIIDANTEAMAFQHFDESDRLVSVGDRPFAFLGDLAAEILDAEDAYQRAMKSVGASLWRDAVDCRVVESVAARSGNLIDSQETWRSPDGVLPGVDDITPVERQPGYDLDQDGMPDEFERRHSLDSTDPSDGNGHDLSTEGFTNLEVYLNSLVH